MEQLDYYLLFHWFVGLSLDAKVWTKRCSSRSAERLIEGALAWEFMAAVLNEKPVKALLLDDHFWVVGTLTEACASTEELSAPTTAATSRRRRGF